MLLISILFSLLLFNKNGKVIFNREQEKDKFYTKVLNYTVPLIKVTSSKQEADKENELLIKGFLNLLGFKSINSLCIVGKEISYLKVDKNYNIASKYDYEEFNKSKINSKIAKKRQESIFNNFTLDDDQILEDELQTKIEPNGRMLPAYNPNLKKTLPLKPEVLIYHTHTCESYKPGPINTIDKTKSVCSVGEELKKELERYGVSVVHDTTVHDTTAYRKSYERSRVTLNKYMNQYKDFKLVIDMHRDSVENKEAVTTTINGENVARFMFVITKKNPHFNNQIKLVKKIINISDKLYPGFCKGIFYYNYGRKFYNQDISNNATLMEIGSHINTTEEAKASAKYLARIIAEYLNGKN
nr:stage II sporulation protein P [Clostridium aestuarii]